MKNEAEAFHVSRTRIIQTRDIFLVLLKCRLALTSMHDCALLATGACRGHSVCDGYGIQEGPCGAMESCFLCFWHLAAHRCLPTKSHSGTETG